LIDVGHFFSSHVMRIAVVNVDDDAVDVVDVADAVVVVDVVVVVR